MIAPTAVPFPDAPSRFVTSRDGTRIAVFSAGNGPAIVLVHGTSSDHRTWRFVAPELSRRRTLHAVDRRGRGDSGDGPTYEIRRELEDVAAVVDEIAAETGRPVDVVGHSLGGRIALGASLLTPNLRQVVAFEGMTTPPDLADERQRALLDRLRADLAAGDPAGLLARFMTLAVGMPAADLERFRRDPVWPLRVAAAPTIVRELAAAEGDRAVSLDALGRVTVPVLQLVGSDSPAMFRVGAAALHARLANGRLAVVEGARHAAHSSHRDAFIAAVEAFLDA